MSEYCILTLGLREKGRQFVESLFHLWKLLYSDKIALKIVPGGLISNKPALVQIMIGAKPLYEPVID